MKLLLVVHGFPPAAQGGSEIYTHRQAVALRRIFGDELLVLTREQDRSRPEYAVRVEHRDGLEIVWINNTFRHTRRFEDTYRNDDIGTIAAGIIDRFRPDVAHLHHLTCLSTTIVAALAARGVPRLMTLHDYWLICHRGQLLDVDYQVCEGPEVREPAECRSCLGPAGAAGRAGFVGAAAARALEQHLPAAGRQARALASRLLRAAPSGGAAGEQARARVAHMREVCAAVTHFIAPSRHMRDRFVRFGIPAERITVAGYGFDAEPFQAPVRTRSDRLRLGFLGSLMVSKAPHVIVEAVDALPAGSVSIDVFGAHTAYHGDDSYRAFFQPLLARPHVRVAGPLPHDRVPDALASIDVLVVPSIWPENSPLVIQEAFLAGVPVLASRIGGIPEFVEDGRNGLLFAPGDAADLARAIGRLLREPALLAKLRDGIPRVRTIEEDVRGTRLLYERYRAARSAPAVPPRLAAVVLNYRTPDDTLLAVKSLLASTRRLDDIIVVDNDPAGDARSMLSGVAGKISYRASGTNLGYSGGMNAGIREALGRGASKILLLNSDVIVPPDGVAHLLQALESTAHAGIVGPVVLSRARPDRVATAGLAYHPATGRMRVLEAGADRDGLALPGSRVVDAVAGCAMLVTRDVFEAAGLLDEDYFFGFEDLDLCWRARRAGFTSIIAGSATAYNEGSRSIGAGSSERVYYAARNHLLFAWRRAPSNRLASAWRVAAITMLNLAHAAKSPGSPLPARIAAVLRGTCDYFSGRLGAGASRRT